MEGAAGLEPVGMGRDAAHGVEADRAADHPVVFHAAEIGPFAVDRDLFLEGDTRQFRGDGADTVRRDAAGIGHGFGGVVVGEIAFCDQVEDRDMGDAVMRPRAGEIGDHIGFVIAARAAFAAVPDQVLAVVILEDQPVFGAVGIAIHEAGRVGVAGKVVEIDLAGLEQAMDEGEDEQPVSARRDADPVVGDGVVAGADRVDPDDPRAAFLEPPEPDLDRVGIVVFGDAEQHEKLRVFPVRLAEFPERAAHRVDAARRHVDRAEPAMGRVIGGAEGLCPVAGEAIATGPGR